MAVDGIQVAISELKSNPLGGTGRIPAQASRVAQLVPAPADSPFQALECDPVLARPSRCCRTPSAAVLCLFALCSVVGCSQAKPWEKVYPATGKITYEGEPVVGAQVVLFPEDPSFPNKIRPGATTDATGEFKLGTYGQNDGAPAGSYRVSVIWHKVVDNGEGAVRGPNVLPAKYSRPDTSELAVKIDPAATQLAALDLKKVDAPVNRGYSAGGGE